MLTSKSSEYVESSYAYLALGGRVTSDIITQIIMNSFTYVLLSTDWPLLSLCTHRDIFPLVVCPIISFEYYIENIM